MLTSPDYLGLYDPPWRGVYRVMYGTLPYTFFPRESYHNEEAYIQANSNWGGFFDRLIASVKEEGFRNPIHVCDGHPNVQRKTKLVPYGASRVWVANKLELPIPAIICDLIPFNSAYDEFEEITSLAQCLSKFTDKPSFIEFRKEYMEFWGSAQSHLEKVHQKWWHDMMYKNSVSKAGDSYACWYEHSNMFRERAYDNGKQTSA